MGAGRSSALPDGRENGVNDGQRFITAEFEYTRPTGVVPHADMFRIQVRSESGASKWLSIPADRFDAVKAAAVGTAGNGYRDRSGIDNRANSALLRIEAIVTDLGIPSAVRLALIAEIMGEEPILTDPSPAARTVRQEIEERRRVSAHRN